MNTINQEIKLTNNKVAFIDEEDYDKVSKLKWYCSNNDGKLYAVNKNKKVLYMHRLIMSAPDGYEVDHINGDGLDNRKVNLRLCSSSQNKYNQKLSSANTSGFKGVTWNKNKGKWQVQIGSRNKYKYLGLFEDKYNAAKAYNKEAVRLFGDFARVNII